MAKNHQLRPAHGDASKDQRFLAKTGDLFRHLSDRLRLGGDPWERDYHDESVRAFHQSPRRFTEPLTRRPGTLRMLREGVALARLTRLVERAIAASIVTTPSKLGSLHKPSALECMHAYCEQWGIVLGADDDSSVTQWVPAARRLFVATDELETVLAAAIAEARRLPPLSSAPRAGKPTKAQKLRDDRMRKHESLLRSSASDLSVAATMNVHERTVRRDRQHLPKLDSKSE